MLWEEACERICEAPKFKGYPYLASDSTIRTPTSRATADDQRHAQNKEFNFITLTSCQFR